MRIVEPQRMQHTTKPARSRRGKAKKKLLYIFVALLLGAVAWLQYGRSEPTQELAPTAVEPGQPQEPQQSEQKRSGLREFSGNEFRLLYDNLLQPDLNQVDVPPVISRNDIADARIRQIAEARGYKLRSSPRVTLPYVDGYPLHEAVHEPWLELKAAAAAEGLSMSIVSAYRSVENQRQLFLSRLLAEGISLAEVANGQADEEIDRVLITTAVPGYSKHHTGYTIDLLCAGYAFENFKNSPCHDWLAANNFEQAKLRGFIPSYPVDADLQGPDPEAWEYVWVGTELLRY